MTANYVCTFGVYNPFCTDKRGGHELILEGCLLLKRCNIVCLWRKEKGPSNCFGVALPRTTGPAGAPPPPKRNRQRVHSAFFRQDDVHGDHAGALVVVQRVEGQAGDEARGRLRPGQGRHRPPHVGASLRALPAAQGQGQYRSGARAPTQPHTHSTTDTQSLTQLTDGLLNCSLLLLCVCARFVFAADVAHARALGATGGVLLGGEPGE